MRIIVFEPQVSAALPASKGKIIIGRELREEIKPISRYDNPLKLKYNGITAMKELPAMYLKKQDNHNIPKFLSFRIVTHYIPSSLLPNTRTILQNV